VPLFQKRHCSAAARLQLLGCAFGSHKPNGDMGQSKYPFFMRGSVKRARADEDTAGSMIRRWVSAAWHEFGRLSGLVVR